MATLGLIATACGDDPDSSGPPVLVVTGSATNSPTASADAALGAPEGKMWAPWRMNFVAGADLPALDSDAKSYVIPSGSVSQSDMADVAAAFGVSGDAVELDANLGGGYRFGSEDGSTSSLWISGDAMRYWSYSPEWDSSAMAGCAIAPSPDGTVSSSPDECARPEPPTNVPTEDEARSLFADIVERVGFDANDMVLESYADEWSATVYGSLKIDGVRSPLTISVGFGGEGAVTYANGFLGQIADGATYPRIGTAAALERLNSDYANPMVRGGVAIDAPMSDVAVSDVATSGVAVAPDTIATSDTGAPSPETVPVDTTPVDMPIEVHDVTIVSVEEELVMLYGSDGSIYLVPGYAFIAADDEYGYSPRYTVSALPDEYVQQADPIAVEPAVVEPQVDPAPTEDSAGAVSSAQAQSLVGLSESDATETAKANGWESRVVSRDGTDLAITMDYRMDRVNLTIVDDVVTASTVG